jgi:hypothetical protein
MLYPKILLALNVGSEARLYFAGSIFAAEHAISSVPHFCYESLYLCLNHHQTLALASELFSHSISSPSSLDINHKEFLCISKDHICIPSLVGINTEQIFDYHLQSGIPSYSTPIDISCEKIISELLLISHVERMFTCYHLIHSDTQGPHICSC